MTTPEPAREIAAAVLLDAYWHIIPVELMLNGAPALDARGYAYRAYYGRGDGSVAQLGTAIAAPEIRRAVRNNRLMDAWGAGARAARAVMEGHTPAKHDDKPDPQTYRLRCFAHACRQDQELIRMDWASYTRKYGLWPRAALAASHADALCWQLEASWLIATGAGEVLHCARVAYDRAAGKPARRRKPADPDWLAAELDASMSALWKAVRDADDGRGNPLWGDVLPGETRPGGGNPLWGDAILGETRPGKEVVT